MCRSVGQQTVIPISNDRWPTNVIYCWPANARLPLADQRSSSVCWTTARRATTDGLPCKVARLVQCEFA